MDQLVNGWGKFPSWENLSAVDYQSINIPQLGSTGQDRLGKFSLVEKVGKVGKGFPGREWCPWQENVSW